MPSQSAQIVKPSRGREGTPVRRRAGASVAKAAVDTGAEQVHAHTFAEAATAAAAGVFSDSEDAVVAVPPRTSRKTTATPKKAAQKTSSAAAALFSDDDEPAAKPTASAAEPLRAAAAHTADETGVGAFFCRLIVVLVLCLGVYLAVRCRACLLSSCPLTTFPRGIVFGRLWRD